jgi:hypothetical protein
MAMTAEPARQAKSASFLRGKAKIARLPMEPIENLPSDVPTPAELTHVPEDSVRSQNRPPIDQVLASYAAGALSWREISDSTGLAYGEVLVELGKRNLALPRVFPESRPVQDALFERALRGGE